MYLKKDGQTWNFPRWSHVAGLDLSTRRKESPKAFQHGAFSSGDGKMEHRTIDVDIFVDGKNISDYFAQVDEIKRYCRREGQQLFLIDGRYINISSMGKLQEKFLKGFYLVKADVTVTLKALDPFFYDINQTEFSTTISTTPKQFTVHNPGNIDTPAKWTITATDSATLITLKNTSDGNRMFSYADAQMIAGQVLVVDSTGETGTVTRGGSNTVNNFTGTWLNLAEGDNVFEYTGGPCTLKVEFTARWL